MPAGLSTAIRIRSQISPMFGLSPATLPHAIRTGSWSEREALTDARVFERCAGAAFLVVALAASLILIRPVAARPGHSQRALHMVQVHQPAARPLHYPRLAWPLEISGTQYAPVA